PQAMPDLWVALSSLAAVGFFLRAARAGATASGGLAADEAPAGEAPAHRTPAVVLPARLNWGALAGLTVCGAIAALVRPGDALYLAVVLGIAILAVRQWRRLALLAAVVIGFGAGAADWVIEAYLRFGGPLHRLHEAGAEQGGFGFHFGL